MAGVLVLIVVLGMLACIGMLIGPALLPERRERLHRVRQDAVWRVDQIAQQAQAAMWDEAMRHAPQRRSAYDNGNVIDGEIVEMYDETEGWR